MFIDIDPTHRRVHGHAKQGAEHGRLKGQRTLHPILATLSTPIARPVIAAVRLRRGKAADVRGAESFVTEALAVAKDAGGTGIRLVRADSKFYTADVAAACRRAGTRFSLTTGMNPSIAAAITRSDAGDHAAQQRLVPAWSTEGLKPSQAPLASRPDQFFMGGHQRTGAFPHPRRAASHSS